MILSLLPVLLVQGQGVRKRTPRFPEAEGPVHGLIAGPGQPLRLIVLGESTVAGVGAATHRQALTGQIALALAHELNRAVVWRAIGSNGVTAYQTRLKLLPILNSQSADLIVVALGVNDVLSLTPPARWFNELRLLIDSIWQQVGRQPLVLAGVPPMAHFPAFPQPLRMVLGFHARTLDWAAAELAETYPEVIHCPTPMPSPGDFAGDGFHPGPAGYAAWGAFLARAICEQMVLRPHVNKLDKYW